MATITKADLSERIVDEVGLNYREAKEMVEAFFEVISQALVDGEEVKISNFGNFTTRDKPTRPGRNPKTGESKPILARRVATFRPSDKLKTAVDESHSLQMKTDQ